MDFIEKEIQNNQYISNREYNINNINKKYLSDVLRNFTSGPNMSSIYVVINELILKYKSDDKYVSKEIYDYISNINYITSGTYSSVISSLWFNEISIIIKNISEYDEFLREYFVGIFGINKLRYKIPTFMYTYGYIRNKKYDDIIYNKIYKNINTHNEYYILCENIFGDTLQKNINKISFSEFLNIIVQILLSLEIAQREICFVHNDLHIGNIILKKLSEPVNYTAILDNKEYKITCKKYIPTIIDFGLSSFKYKDRNIRQNNFEYVNNYLEPCFDVYRFLISVLINTKNQIIINFIKNIFINIFGKYDPYKIFMEGELNAKNLSNCSSEWCLKLTKPININKFTPKIVLDYIINSYNIQNIIVQDRENFINISSFNLEKVLLNNIFSINTFNSNNIINNIIKKCFSSYNKNYNIISNRYLNYIYKNVIEKNNLSIISSLDYHSSKKNIRINIDLNQHIKNFSKLLDQSYIYIMNNQNIDIDNLKQLFYEISEIFDLYYCYQELKNNMLIGINYNLEKIYTDINYNKYYTLLRWKNVLDNNNYKEIVYEKSLKKSSSFCIQQ